MKMRDFVRPKVKLKANIIGDTPQECISQAPQQAGFFLSSCWQFSRCSRPATPIPQKLRKPSLNPKAPSCSPREPLFKRSHRRPQLCRGREAVPHRIHSHHRRQRAGRQIGDMASQLRFAHATRRKTLHLVRQQRARRPLSWSFTPATKTSTILATPPLRFSMVAFLKVDSDQGACRGSKTRRDKILEKDPSTSVFLRLRLEP